MSLATLFTGLLLVGTATQAIAQTRPVASEAPGTGSLAIEAGLVFNSGDVKPVARADLALLDASVSSLVTSAGIDPPRKVQSLSTDEQVLFSFAMAVRFGVLNELIEYQDKVLAMVKSHTKYAGTTDFGGKVTISGISPGKYYLFGYSRGGESVAVWNLPVEIGSGQTSLVLENKNASVY